MKVKLSMSSPSIETTLIRLLKSIETQDIVSPETSAKALAVVRDGVITGEGPTTSGRVHFSRSLDAQDADLCVRLLSSAALDSRPVSRAEAEVLFRIDEAASDRSDSGRFDDLFAKAIVHHAAAASGLPVPSRAIALSADTPIDSWAPTRAVGVNTDVLEWIAAQMRGRRRSSRTLNAIVATLVGAATLAQAFPGFIDFSL